MAKIKWTKAAKGLEFYSHGTRKHGVRFDRYYRGRYTVDKITTTVSLGWESEWAARERARGSKKTFLEYCKAELARLKENARRGSGPKTIKEERALAEIQRKEEELAKVAEEKASLTFARYFTENYYPVAMTSKKQRSHEQELSHFKYWLNPVIGDMRLKDIRPLHLERIKKNMLSQEKPRSPRMIQYVFATGRQCWNYARRDGIVAGEWPGKDVKIPKVENQRMRFLMDAEGDQLLEGLKKRSQQLHDICLLSLDAGLRANEIFSLAWNRVDLEQKAVKVFDSKGRDRVVYLTERAVDMLRGLPQENGLVFKSRTGEQITEISNSFGREVNHLGLNDGVTNPKDKLVFHSLRHSYASRLVSKGVDLYVVGQLMGHSDLTMTKRYSHLKPNTLQAAVGLLDRREPQGADVIPIQANGKK